MTRPLLLPLALSAVLVTALGGCSLFAPAPEVLPTVEIEKLSTPESMQVTANAVDLFPTILPPTDDAPWAIAASVAAPASGGVPTVWTSADGATWTESPVVDGFDGDFTGEMSGSDELSAIGGYSWNEGTVRSRVFTSTDRSEWSEVELPEDFASRYRIVDLVVVGDEVFAIARTPESVVTGIRISKDEVTEFALPSAGDDDLSPWALSTDGSQLVLLAEPGPEGSPSPTVSYGSDDNGESWSDAAIIADELSVVSGITFTGSGYSATGAAPASAEPGAVLRPAAWFSTDGTSWAAESIPAPTEGSPSFYFETADVYLGAPLARDGIVTAVAANDNAAMSAGYSRGVDGVWSYRGDTSNNASNGLGGVAIILDGETLLTAIEGSTYARLGTLSPSGWADTIVLSERQNIFQVNDFITLGDGQGLTLSRSTFTVGGELAWSNRTEFLLAEREGEAISEVAWDPERAGTLSGVRLASDDNGAEVIIGGNFPQGGGVILAEGWYRASPDDEWTPLMGFTGSGATNFATVQKIGDTWTAVGTYAASSTVGTASHGIVWQSADGISWAQASGDFGSGSLDTAVEDVCTLPDGTPLAVGWAEQSSGGFRAVTWTAADGTWTRGAAGDFEDQNGYALSCASGEDGVVVGATLGARSTLQLTADGNSWEEVFRAERGISLGEPVAVTGGFAASGSWSVDDTSSAVVWLSADGTEWNPVAIPSYTTGSTLAVAASGDDLLVAMNARVGHPVSLVKDIGAVIARNGG